MDFWLIATFTSKEFSINVIIKIAGGTLRFEINVRNCEMLYFMLIKIAIVILIAFFIAFSFFILSIDFRAHLPTISRHRSKMMYWKKIHSLENFICRTSFIFFWENMEFPQITIFAYSSALLWNIEVPRKTSKFKRDTCPDTSHSDYNRVQFFWEIFRPGTI